MSAGEIGWRLRELWRWRAERRLWQRGAAAAAALESAGGGKAAALVQAAAELVPGTRQQELDRLERDFPETFTETAGRAAGAAESVFSGEWMALGHPLDLRGAIDWERDPRSGYRWPKTFCADVPLGLDGNSGVDVKYVWELGRHQYLVELARGWLFTRKEQYAGRARELLVDWIRRSPLYEGVHWTCALEVAMRAISWLWAAASLSAWDGWEAKDLERLAASLADHATYLEHHLSLYSSPYNHLIGETTALYLIGVVLRQSNGSASWRQTGRQVLLEYGPRQFYADGFTVEQANGYHFYTLGFLSLAIAAARQAGEPLADLEEVAHRAFRAGAAFQQPDGRWPAIGDVDSARSIPVHHDDFWDFRSLLSLGAVLFDDPTLSAGCDSPGEELYWLLGCEGVERWHGLPKKAAASQVVLRDSGYAVARAGGDWLLFDAGPIAAGVHEDATPSTAHGHADALQVLVWLAGNPVLCDAGMPFYTGPAEWVRHFRGPAAHNTLEIEGVEMARHAGSLDWSHVAGRPQLDANLSEEVWLARGRAEWSPGVVVERNLLMLPGRGLWVADYIQTDRPRRVRWYWQLPAGTVRCVEEDGSTRCLVAGDRISLATWSTSGPIRARLETPGEDSPIGWSAPGYGVRHKAQRVCQEAQATSTLLVATHFGNPPAPTEVNVRGRRLRCLDQNDAPPLAPKILGQEPAVAAEVTWRIAAEAGLVTYLAGSVGRAEPDPIRLCGAGDWPAWACHAVGSMA